MIQDPHYDLDLLVECLETQLLEEPLVLAALVTIFETHSDLETGLLALDWVFQVLHAIFVIQTNFWNAVTCWHQVIVVHELKLQQ